MSSVAFLLGLGAIWGALSTEHKNPRIRIAFWLLTALGALILSTWSVQMMHDHPEIRIYSPEIWDAFRNNVTLIAVGALFGAIFVKRMIKLW